MKISNLDAAFEIISKGNEPLNFKDLWSKICEYQEINLEDANSKVGKFYTQLSLDGRFITLADGRWDLRVKYTFDKVHLDITNKFFDEDNQDDNTKEISENASEKELFGEEEENLEGEDEESSSNGEEF